MLLFGLLTRVLLLICVDIAQFIAYTHLTHTYVTLPNKQRIRVAGIGTVALSSYFTLTHILHISEFNVNLISVGALLSTQLFDVFFLIILA